MKRDIDKENTFASAVNWLGFVSGATIARMLTVIYTLVALEVSAEAPSRNVQLRVAERHSFDANGKVDFYTEVLKDGSNFIASITRIGVSTEITFWFDERRTLSLIDTNGDGRSDQFWFSSDFIPQSEWLRDGTNGLYPTDSKALRKAQEFSRLMLSEFPKVVTAAASSNSVEFLGQLSNVTQKAIGGAETRPEP